MEEYRKPLIIIVPGYGGCQLTADLLPDHPEFSTHLKSSFTIWINPWKSIARQNFFVNNFLLKYDKTQNKMVSQDNIIIKSDEIGNTKSIEYLIPLFPHLSSYFNTFINDVIDNFGCKLKEDIFAAPYDFRNIADIRNMHEYFDKIESFIVNICQTKRSKILFVSHSLGSTLVNHFLVRKDQKWKDKYVDSWYSIAGCFGGSVDSVFKFIKGFPFIFNSSTFQENYRKIYASFPTSVFLFPSKSVFDETRIFIKENDLQYNASNLIECVEKFSPSDVFQVKDYIPQLFLNAYPGVDTIIAYSVGLPTLSQIIINGDINSYKISENYDDGDGTLLTESLIAPKKWRNNNGKYFEFFELKDIQHTDLLSNEQLLNHFTSFFQTRIKY